MAAAHAAMRFPNLAVMCSGSVAPCRKQSSWRARRRLSKAVVVKSFEGFSAIAFSISASRISIESPNHSGGKLRHAHAHAPHACHKAAQMQTMHDRASLALCM